MSATSWQYEAPSVTRARQAKESAKWVWVKCSPRTMPKVGSLVMIWREGFPNPIPAYMRSDGSFGLGSTVYQFVSHWMVPPPPPVNVA